MFRATWGYYIKSGYTVGGYWGARAPSAGLKQDPGTVLRDASSVYSSRHSAGPPLRARTQTRLSPPGQLQCFPFKSPITTAMSNSLASTYINCMISRDEET